MQFSIDGAQAAHSAVARMANSQKIAAPERPAVGSRNRRWTAYTSRAA